MNHLELDSVHIQYKAMGARDLRPLLGNRTLRGGNRTMPGAVGTRPLAGVLDEIDVSIEWVVTGQTDETGAPNADMEEGLSANLAYYQDLFMNSGDATTGLVDAVLHMPDDDYVAEIQCRAWSEVWTGPISAVVVTRLVVPAGLWTPAP